jgi:hypothetical protein
MTSMYVVSGKHHGIRRLISQNIFPVYGNDGVPLASPDYVTPKVGSTHNLVAAQAGMVIADRRDDTDKSTRMVEATMVLFDVAETYAAPTTRDACVDAGGVLSLMTPVTVPIKYRGVNICALSMENELSFTI